MKIKSLVTNALIAALYVVVTWLIVPFGFTHIQFRISELFNHLIVFNKKYFFGIVLGVFFANLFFSPIVAYDLLFGLSHTILSLLITIFISRYIKNKIALMAINTVVFSFNMFIIAIMLKLILEVDLPFGFIWFTTAVGEFIVMAIAIPIVYALGKRLKFKELV